ncbi:MAG: hypothetical protein J5J00_00415 [Deltaproteobacteria bacterium]|nr:hypothetical protein [Deltaproteobacteria bacterium]
MAFDFKSRYKDLIGRQQAVECPAKVNLRLKIEGLREDGYHLLSMINTPIDLTDQLFLKLDGEGRIEAKIDEHFGEWVSPRTRGLIRQNLSNEKDNHAWQAATQFFERFQIPLGLSILVRKGIPTGAGLGGGSSNAGRLLAWLFSTFREHIQQGLGLPLESAAVEVEKIAFAVGADVPYFLSGGLAWVSGVGEQVQQLHPRIITNYPALLVIPDEQISTAKVYSVSRERLSAASSAMRDEPGRDFVARYCDAVSRVEGVRESSFMPGDLFKSFREELKALIMNDLEDSARACSSVFDSILSKLRGIPDAIVSMSGSGSAVLVLPKTKNFVDSSMSQAVNQALQDQPVMIRPTILCPAG